MHSGALKGETTGGGQNGEKGQKRKKREEDINGEARRGQRVKRRAVCMRNYSLGHDDTMHQSALLT